MLWLDLVILMMMIVEGGQISGAALLACHT
jgi:hypothetical protein